MALSKTLAVGEVLTAQDTNEHLVNHVPNPGDSYDTGWVALPLQNGWTFVGSTTPAWRRIGLVIYLRGEILAGSTGSSSPFTVLPVAARPPARMRIPAGWGASQDSIGIETNGSMWTNIGITSTPGVMLSHISYPAQ